MPTIRQALDELQQLYIELEEEVRSLHVACIACGTCCRFDEAEHVLCASKLELLLLSLNFSKQPDLPSGLCPFHVNNQCTAREHRMLGCRLHFCTVTAEQQQSLESLSIRYHERLAALHEAHGVPYEYGPAFLGRNIDPT